MNDTVTIRVIGTVKYEIEFPKDYPNVKEEAIKLFKHDIKESLNGEVYENTIRVEKVEE
jgi:hypothetical protein